MAKSKKYLFDLNVNAEALFQANPTEFYTKALLEQRSTSHFRQLLNVKEKTKIGTLDFDAPLQVAGCDFVATNSNLDAKPMEPCKIGLGVELCQYDIESSFLVEQMKAGSSTVDFMPAEFATHYYDELARAVSDNLEVLTWQGDEAGDPLVIGNLVICDGLNKKLADATIPVAQRIAGAAITSANVIAEMTKVFNQIPTRLKRKKAQIKWFVSSNVADAYALAVAQASAEAFTTKDEDLRFIGITLVVGEGMSDNTQTLSLASNYIFLADMLSDQEDITTINMKATTGDRKIRSISDFKFGVDLVNDDEWVVYGIPATP